MDGYCLTVGKSFYPTREHYEINDFDRMLRDKFRTAVSIGIQFFRDAVQYGKEQAAAKAAHKAEVIDFPDTKEDTNETAPRLLDQYGNMILRLAYSYLHNQSDAEDILQETLIKYMQTAPNFAGPVHEKAWLLKVAANLSKNRIDYNRLRETDELEETLVAKERQDLSFVWEAVKQLPANYRAAIHLFYYEGCSTAEIARILDRKESSVRSDLRRGREQLKNILKEAYDFE